MKEAQHGITELSSFNKSETTSDPLCPLAQANQNKHSMMSLSAGGQDEWKKIFPPLQHGVTG